jgi:hypothetical protein
VEIQYSKAIISDTGIRTIWFDATPDTTGDAIPLPECPKRGPMGDACKLKLVQNRSKNPALLVQVSVAANVIDPVSATSKR